MKRVITVPIRTCCKFTIANNKTILTHLKSDRMHDSSKLTCELKCISFLDINLQYLNIINNTTMEVCAVGK